MSSKFELTPAQKKAVDLRGHTMLVSAAAGSGKTAVLTKRIIKLVTDIDNPVDISELLVVTFTKAAATELKERISSSIYSALKEDPTNKHLSNQLLKLGKAKICTIHSFCADLVRNNFQALGLPASLRIADETESGLICNNLMNELIDSCYGGLYSEKITDFADFTENFLQAKKDDSLPLTFARIYNYLRNFPLGIDLLHDCVTELEIGSKNSPLDTKWGQNIRANLKRTFGYYFEQYENACAYFADDNTFAVKYLPAFEEDRRICYEIAVNAESYSYTQLADCFFSKEKLKLGSVKGDCQTEESTYYKEMRAEFWEKLNKAASKYFAFSESTVKSHFLKTAEVCKNMHGFLSMFEEMYKEEKRNRGLLDYNDLETFTLRLLYDDKACTRPSEFSKSIKDKYKYIFIDEYQDVNELQDKIFLGLSTPKNRFMVGDIKQSIYGFRGSEPALFSEYRMFFPECSAEEDECPDSDGITIYLSNNFRSDRTVIDFSNAVFEVLFNNNSGKAPYTEGDRLVCSKVYKEDEHEYNVRLCFMEEDQNIKGIIREAEFVADEIEKLVKGGTDPSDIAILFRSRNNTVYFEEALKKRKISSFNQVDRDFFENDAVLLMLCILNTVDNPGRDIYLAGVLKSPIFAFSMSEITRIRRFEKKGSLYNAVKKYAELTHDKKCIYFLNKLTDWRKYAEGCPVDKLVRHIYNETHIVELLSGKKTRDSDIERQANLLLLYEYARQFENGSFKGLYNFILYLNDVLDKKTKLSNARLTSEGKGVVNIMSVHNSKGLEFDTVFFCDTAHEFNRGDERSSFIIHKNYGLTLRLRDTTSFGKFNTLPRCAAETAKREEALDEEIRVLYVALTRAKKRLIITSSQKNAREEIERISSEICRVSHYVLLEAKNMSELLLWGILKSDYNDYSIEYIKPKESVEKTDNEQITERILNEDLISKYEKLIEERLSFEYPYSELTVLPSKLAVSKLYPGVLDEYTTEAQQIAPSMYVKPKFLLPDRATGAERGTATHVFMQFCNFENACKNGVQAELARLVEKGFIDEHNAKLVNREKVKDFFNSELYRSLLNAKKIWRERRFNIKLPASSFTQNMSMKEKYTGEYVLVQGVIDLLYLDENDRLVLSDYKTDWFSNEDILSGDAEKILIERHKNQLSYYAEACKKMFGRNVDSILIYSFALGKAITVK